MPSSPTVLRLVDGTTTSRPARPPADWDLNKALAELGAYLQSLPAPAPRPRPRLHLIHTDRETAPE